ncbi:MAG: hypothetical protein ABIW85_09210 [Variovorax sp.]
MFDPVLLTVYGLVAIFVLVALHVPVGVAMGIAAVVGFGMLAGFGPAFAMIASEASNNLASLDLATIPLGAIYRGVTPYVLSNPLRLALLLAFPMLAL